MKSHHDLNKERVSPPRGRSWNASTINGNLQRGTGLIQSELYAGRLVWNKVRMIKDPDTGKRLSRPNAKTRVADRRTCRISALSPRGFLTPRRAASKLAANTPPRPAAAAAPHAVGILLRAAGQTVRCWDVDEAAGISRARIRIRCSAATESSALVAMERHSISRPWKARFLCWGWKQSEMRHPSVIAEYVRTYHDERKRPRSQSRTPKRAHLELRLGELNREIDRLVDAIAKGHGDPASGSAASLACWTRSAEAGHVRELSAEPAASTTLSRSTRRGPLRAMRNSSSICRTRCRRA